MDKEKENFFIGLKNLFIDYLQNRLELLRLTAYEKTARLMALLFSGIILTILFFFSILFLSIVVGFYFSSVFESMALGFSVIAGFYLAVFIVLLIFRKQLIEKYIINTVISVLFEDDEDQEK